MIITAPILIALKIFKNKEKGKQAVTLHLQIDSLVAEHWWSHSYANTSYKRKLHWTLYVPGSIGLIFTCLPIFIDLSLCKSQCVHQLLEFCVILSHFAGSHLGYSEYRAANSVPRCLKTYIQISLVSFKVKKKKSS